MELNLSLRSNLSLVLFIIMFLEKSSMKQMILEEQNNNVKDLMNQFDDEENTPNAERYARHVEAVTETMLQHVMNEIRNEYLKKTYDASSPLRKLIRTLDEQLKNNKRCMLEQQKQKLAKQKKKHSNRKGRKKFMRQPKQRRENLQNQKHEEIVELKPGPAVS